MFEKIGQLAEKAASNVNLSRRGFLGRLGKAALIVAGGLGFSGVTAEGASGAYCCFYVLRSQTPWYDYLQLCSAKPCPPSYSNMFLGSKTKVANCAYCPTVSGTRCI